MSTRTKGGITGREDVAPPAVPVIAVNVYVSPWQRRSEDRSSGKHGHESTARGRRFTRMDAYWPYASARTDIRPRAEMRCGMSNNSVSSGKGAMVAPTDPVPISPDALIAQLRVLLSEDPPAVPAVRSEVAGAE